MPTTDPLTTAAITLADLFPWPVFRSEEASRKDANCASGEHDPDMWFPDPTDDYRQAVEVCMAACPLREACLEAALTRREPDGVWGGVLFRRGRPVTPGTAPAATRTEASPPVPAVA